MLNFRVINLLVLIVWRSRQLIEHGRHLFGAQQFALRQFIDIVEFHLLNNCQSIVYHISKKLLLQFINLRNTILLLQELQLSLIIAFQRVVE